MKRATSILAAALLILVLGAPQARAESFGLEYFDVTFTNGDGTLATEAGTHPYAMTISLQARLGEDGVPVDWLRDLIVKQIPGLVGDATAYPRCTTIEFLQVNQGQNDCPLETTVGLNAVSTNPGLWTQTPVFNLVPPAGVLVRLGFRVAGTENIVIDVGLTQDPPYRAVGGSRNTPQLARVLANKLQLWGDPASSAHDELRGICGGRIEDGLSPNVEDYEFASKNGALCPTQPRPKPFLTLPTNCSEPLASTYDALSWSGATESGFAVTHDEVGNPKSFNSCAKLPFHPSITGQPTTKAAGSPTGLDFSLDIEDEGLVSISGRAHSQIRKVIATLPEGMTANPSVAAGLETCSEGDLARETLDSEPGQGCPEASKIGTIETESPLVDQPLRGALYQATPFANLADDSFLAFYIVLKNSELGVVVKQIVKVFADSRTGQLVSVSDELPQLPFEHFNLHFREGGRSPLVSPPTCGVHEVKAELTPWSGTAPVISASTFTIISGPNEGACPAGGRLPFEPGFQAGSENNSAGRFSPFAMRITRRDGDQDLTRFDATLPPGVVAKLASVTQCSDVQIASAKDRSGLSELANPSCPMSSEIGTVKAGAGVGSQLTYATGAVYLAGPFGGEPISAVGIVPAVAGPFDIGTVVTRQALHIDPTTARVSVDGAKSDPIPHILQGIPLVIRDIQVRIDRSSFTLNPTSCDPFAVKASIWGGGSDLFSTADDSPVARESRYQASDCAALGFKPRLAMRLRGGTARGDFPRFHFVYRPRSGDANVEDLALRFPRSEFIEQGHFRTICTRAQFVAGAGHGSACPQGAIYGQVKVVTPILSEPLTGPVFLRSSNHSLPDVVLALHGPKSLPIQLEVSTRIDSVKGGLRAIAQAIPDAPVTEAVLNMQGGQKGLFVNSTNLCRAKHRARIFLAGHNGKRITSRPVLAVRCRKG
jgi:hypothetical protein